MLDRCTPRHILKCGPRSWRTKTDLPEQENWAKRTKSRLHRWPVFDLTTIGALKLTTEAEVRADAITALV